MNHRSCIDSCTARTVSSGIPDQQTSINQTCVSIISISGAPLPVVTDGPGWSDPGQVHAESLCPGRTLMGPPLLEPVAAAGGVPS